jgi:poly-gamma-glutamate synthesis protein (capsule biosynthesis protein)
VTLAFGGDVHFEGVLRSKLQTDPLGMFSPIAPTLTAADVAMVNLETAVTERGSAQGKQYVFRTSPRAFDALRAAGVDVVTMANNHGIDFGPVGLQDSLAAIAASGFPTVGIGVDAASAYRPWRVEVKGQRLAVFGATDVLDGALEPAWTAADGKAGLASAKGANLTRLADAVRAARTDSDTVVVYLHWGVEGQSCPSARQREVAQVLTAAGADVVVGSHAHRVMGAGRLGGAFVAYGLGNFAFYNESGPSGATGVLEVTVTGRAVGPYAWIPARIRGGVPTPLADSQAAAARASWEAQRACTGLAP